MSFDEWFHKEYDPADLQLKHMIEAGERINMTAESYRDDLKKAFEAGLHADVHTDNSKVIAELVNENAELVQNKYNLEYKIENLENKIEHHQEVIDTFKKVNAELKEKLKPENCLKSLAKSGFVKFTTDTADQLTNAKKIIKKLVDGIRVISDPKVELTDVDSFVAEAENFLKDSEVEK